MSEDGGCYLYLTSFRLIEVMVEGRCLITVCLQESLASFLRDEGKEMPLYEYFFKRKQRIPTQRIFTE